jgi:hypothetical protein
MARTTNLSRPIIEALYSEALILADEVRAVFAAGVREPLTGEDAYVRLALSTEGLKTTTRMMHVLAWLLNQRALFSGELTENQVRLHGALPPDRASDAAQLALLAPPAHRPAGRGMARAFRDGLARARVSGSAGAGIGAVRLSPQAAASAFFHAASRASLTSSAIAGSKVVSRPRIACAAAFRSG